MRVIILTSARRGTASYFLPHLIKQAGIEVALVVHSKNAVTNRKRLVKKRIQKIRKIGILGAINGIRMRKWFQDDMAKYVEFRDIEELCKANQINFEETDTINCPRTKDLFSSANADLGLSLGNGYIASSVFNLPKYGMINLHGEQLPAYKNAQSVIWQIFNESPQTGYTIHEVSKGIDAGRILKQEVFPIEFRPSLGDTVAFNCAQILKRSVPGMIDVLVNFKQYQGNAKEQKGGSSYTTPSIYQFLRILKNYRRFYSGRKLA